MALSLPLVWPTSTGSTSRRRRSGSGSGRRPRSCPPGRRDRGHARRGRRRRGRARPHDDAALEAVHGTALLRSSPPRGPLGGGPALPIDPGQDRVVRASSPTRDLWRHRPLVPVATWARPGAFCFDTMTLIGLGTWEAACSRGRRWRSTAADLVAGGRAARVYLLSRPAITSREAPTAAVLPQQCRYCRPAVCASSGPTVSRSSISMPTTGTARSRSSGSGDVFTGVVHVDPATGSVPPFRVTASGAVAVMASAGI